jgi:uncharacterized protein YegL
MMINNRTEIIFLLDRSGSMAGLESDTIGGFNSFIKRQREHKGETTVTTVLFDDKYEVLWQGVAANEVQLTDKTYYVRGTTALLDAVGKAVNDADRRINKLDKETKPDNVIFVITTDGLENASREFTYGKIEKLIRQKQENDNWEFIFLGANIDVAHEARNIGIDVNNAYNFEATKDGVEMMYEKICEEVSLKRNSREL